MRKVVTMASPDQLYQCLTPNCNYIYDPKWGDQTAGISLKTNFEDLPEDWRCPYCGGGRERFRRLAQGGE